MAFDVAKFIVRFVEEAREHIGGLNRGLVELEKNPGDEENINAIFRAAHTIKGSSRMLKLTAITEVAHKLEDALGALREKRIAHTRELADLLFNSVDALAAMIQKVSDGQQITMDNLPLCEALAQAAGGALSAGSQEKGNAVQEATEAVSACVDVPLIQPERPEPTPPQQAKPASSSESIRVKSDKLDDLIRLMGEVVSHQNKLKQRIMDISVLEREAKRTLDVCSLVCDGSSLTNARDLHMGLKQLLSVMRQDKTMQDILTTEFQEKALMLRMVPLSTVFDPLHRLVRDIADSLGKELDFEIEGGEIELDKKMIEKLSDPLVHMLRNSIDHGIEEPEGRRRAGKPPKGRVRLSAAYDAGNILIELTDDGAGISTTKIKKKALANRLFDPATLDTMPEAALLDLIFLPGFSTSGIITDVSGRGVGMDVVKKNLVEDLKGTVHIMTKEGVGSTFSIRLPMTLAIMRILLISCQGMKFGITTHYVTEIIKVKATEIIDVVSRKALRLREEFIPIAEMESVLNIAKNGQKKPETLLILIVQLGSEKMGFMVDAILDEEDMVIKSLPDHLKSVRLVSGVTISGKNEIINILNMPAAMEAARNANKTGSAGQTEEGAGQEVTILVVDDSINTREIEKSILEAYGYRVTIAGDGMEALQMAGESRYDLVITDVEMPRLDGFSLTERLRSDNAYKEVPIIIVTSREKDEDKRRGISVGANAYIVKGSFDQSNLVETVQNLIGKGRRL
ncbi:MAG: hybrid sensor histidine kinase/response regulator [Nitrospirae bacterium]|nr:hybrid sensor histidine kinase/response regulator [Nitrospirota bacterium]